MTSRLRIVGRAAFGLAVLANVHPVLASGAPSIDLGTISSLFSGGGGAGAGGPAASAPAAAPIRSTQPTSVISGHFIKHNLAPGANYDSAISVAPSVFDVAPNGAGLMESQALSIRGFQDGEFNVTFDGIPWGDSNDFTHHTTSYFMGNDLGPISVERGPGTASTIGWATFGGTVAVHSKAPPQQPSLNPYLTYGSFGTRLYGFEMDTGVMPNYHGTRADVDVQHLTADGFLTNSGLRRNNVFLKIQRPVGERTLWTVVGMYNRLTQNVPLGATRAEIAKYGNNFGLSADPTQQNYYGYNFDKIRTFMTYLGVRHRFANNWLVDNKLYTYGYRHAGFNGADPNGSTPNGTVFGPNDVPGQRMEMNYQSVGDIARLTAPTPVGAVKTGIWVDHQWNHRSQFEIDWTLGGAFNTKNPANLTSYVDRLLDDTLTTVEPYAELHWHPLARLTVIPGVRYVYFRRSIDAQVNQGTGLPLNFSKSWSSVLPSLALRYRLSRGLSTYFQFAKGYLAPNLNVFYTTNPAASSVNPQNTTNYQLGMVWHTRRFALDADIYRIDFNNKASSRVVAGNQVFFNEGGVQYQGFEGALTYRVLDGLDLYVNGSVNSAKENKAGTWVPNTPSFTSAQGVIYRHGPWYASFIDKTIGPRFGDTGNTQPLGTFSVADATLSYHLVSAMVPYLQDATVNFQLKNVFDRKGIFALAGYTADNTPLYWTIPERAYYVRVSARF